MTCPVCGGHTSVVDSRTDCEQVVRRRKCDSCGRAIYTSELETEDAKENFRRLSLEAKKQCRHKKIVN